MSRPVSLCLSVVSALIISGCGTPSKQDPKDPSGESTSSTTAKPTDKDDGPTKPDEPKKAAGMPTECDKMDGDLCLPPARFARMVCEHEFPSVAFAMFAQGTPWTRAYLTINAGGAQKDELKQNEEVIILTHRTVPKSNIQVSGLNDSFEVIRWNGACQNLEQPEIRFEAPSRPLTARIIWKRLEVDIREALKKDEEIYEAYLQLRKTCKGVSVGAVSDKCVIADTAMSKLLAKKNREGVQMPPPHKVPK